MTTLTTTLASIDGELMDAAEATIPATDDGLLRGDGVFEVLRLYAGRPFAFDGHLARMELSAANLRLDIDIDAVREEAERLLEQAGEVDALLRVLVTRGGHRLAFVEPLPSFPHGLRMGYVEYAPTRILDNIKSLSYGSNMLATRIAKERGFDEALLLTPHGRVLEAPTSSLFWVSGGELLTPPLADHILPSITRARVVELCGAREQACAPEDLESADEAFLASTLREVQGIAQVEETELSAPGPLTEDAARRFAEYVATAL